MRSLLTRHGKPALLLVLFLVVAALIVGHKSMIHDGTIAQHQVSSSHAEQSTQPQAPALDHPVAASREINNEGVIMLSGANANRFAGAHNAFALTRSPTTGSNPEQYASLIQETKTKGSLSKFAQIEAREREEASREGEREESESEKEEERKQDQPDQALKWRMLSMVDENGTIPLGTEMRAWLQAKLMPVDLSAWPAGDPGPTNSIAGINPAGWTWLGPGNIGGRVYSVSPLSGWLELNNNLGITQFYGGAGNSAGTIIGGTQDNGTLRYAGNTETWNSMNGGDGGWSASDQTDPNYFYGEFQWLQIHRSSNGGASSQTIYSGMNSLEYRFRFGP